MLKRFLFALFAFFLPYSVWAQTLGFSITGGRSKVQIPIEVYNNLAVVPIILNGKIPLKFILDTGVRNSILTEKSYTDILNLRYTRKYSIGGIGGEKYVEAYITNNVSFDMPGVHGEGHSLLVLDKDYLELRNYLGTDVHGVLGYELFSRFIVQIDYERKILTIMLPEKFRKKRKFKELPITVEDTKPYLHATVQIRDTTRIPVKLLVDSGASHGLILESDSTQHIIAPPSNVKSIIGRGLGGVIMGKIARIQSIEVNEFGINNVIANFPDEDSYNDTLKMSRVVKRNGAIGGEILTRFSVIFDFPHEKLYLRKGPSFNKKFYYNLSGITVKAKGARLKKYEVTDVRENSAGAKAGILVGDNILSVNGIPSNTLNLSNLNAIFNERPKKRLRLEIERGAQVMKIEFRLADQI
jgi:hypothetical protein